MISSCPTIYFFSYRRWVNQNYLLLLQLPCPKFFEPTSWDVCPPPDIDSVYFRLLANMLTSHRVVCFFPAQGRHDMGKKMFPDEPPLKACPGWVETKTLARFHQPAGFPRAAEDQSMIQRFGCSVVKQTGWALTVQDCVIYLHFLVITVIVIIVLVIKFVSFFCTNYNGILFILIKRWNLKFHENCLRSPVEKNKTKKTNRKWWKDCKIGHVPLLCSLYF